jgi:phosphoglycolate phosphatase
MGGWMDLIIFDLDGTLVDSWRDIATSVNELLDRLGRPDLPPERIRTYIGNGVRKLLERSLGGETPPSELDQAQERYLSIYRRHLLDTTVPYPGVREALEALAPGRSLAVLTNKPSAETLDILEGLGLDQYFQQVCGGESFARRKPDPMAVHALIESTGARPERTLMVGDSRVDFDTARNAGIRVCMVTYGLEPDAIQPLTPDYVVDDLRELVSITDSLP